MKWQTARLSRLAKVIRGVSFDSSEPSPIQLPGHVPILRAGNIGCGLDTVNDLIWVPAARVSEEQGLKAGDIAIAMSSGSTNVVGKTARLSQAWGGSVGAFCAIIRPLETVRATYLAYWLLGPAFTAWRQSQCMGLNIKNLRKAELERLEVPVPPPSEQRRIVEILDQADALRRKRAEADAKAGRILPALFYKMFGDPATNPKGLMKKKLGDLMKVRSGDFLPARNMDGNGRYPVYGGNGINGYHSEFMFKAPMIVLGRVGVYCGVVHYTEPQCWVTDNALYVAEHSDEVRPRYLAEALRVANLNQYAGRAGQPLISGSRIYPVEILVPDKHVQDRFAQSVEMLGIQKGHRERAANGIEKLFLTLLHRAFAGDLTAKWREAHMADLLAEMKAQARALSEIGNGE